MEDKYIYISTVLFTTFNLSLKNILGLESWPSGQAWGTELTSPEPMGSRHSRACV